MSILIFSLIIFQVFLNVSAQLSLKFAMSQIGYFEFSWQNAGPIFLRILASGWIWAGIGTYAVGLFIWLMILSRTEVSIAYPLVSMGYILNAIAAYYLFGENLTVYRMSGILLILLGVFMVSRS